MNRAVWATFLVIPIAAFAADHNWRAYLGDSGATHYSNLSSINTRNVQRLGRAWEFRSGDLPPGNRSQIQCNPLVIDGVLYGTSPALALFALDAVTGRELWRFVPAEVPPGVSRGLAWWQEGAEHRLLFGAGRFLHAVDPATGELISSFGQNGRIDLLEELDRDATGLALAMTSPGVVYRDLIIVPTRVSEGPAPAAPGHIRAFDVRTGERRWIFHTIPFPGEFGYDSWPKDAWERVGGVNCWAGMAIDHERGMVFAPTGSATFDFWGGDRGGANLFANCLIALDAATGQRKWHFQFVHHDLWDRDLPAPPVLCEVTRNGRKIAAVAQITKSAHVWVFDRETGESLFPWREEPVPPSTLRGELAAAGQPVPLRPAPFARQRFTEEEVTNRSSTAHAAVLRRLREVNPHQPWDPPSERGTVVLPGFDGGGEWGGPAVDPRGVLYVNANEMAWILQMVPTAVFGAGPQALYAQLCMSCHGANREGNAAANIPNLQTVAARLTPEAIIALLRSGKGMMPSFNFLAPAVRESLVRFLLAPDSEEPGNQREPLNTGAGQLVRGPYVTTGYNRFLDPDGYPALRPPWGTLNAIDLNTGARLWQRPLGELPELTATGLPPTGTENYGGPIVTAGGLIFIAATKDEQLRAFAAATGELLWQASLPAAGYATPATYEVDGRQFVVVACGGGKIGTKSGDSYVAFALP